MMIFLESMILGIIAFVFIDEYKAVRYRKKSINWRDCILTGMFAIYLILTMVGVI